MPGTAVATTSRAPDRLSRSGDPSHTVVVEVLEQGVVGGEGAGPHPRSELGFLVGERGFAEARGQPRFALDLDDQHAHARAGRCGGQRGGHRRLADPTLARHDHDPGGRAEALEVHGHRCYGSPHRAPDAPRPVRCSCSLVACSLLALDTLAGAATPPVGRRGIDVVQVEGYLDPPNVSLILDAIDEANENRSTLLVLQLKSSGAIDTDIEEVVRAIQRSRVPVVVWVGPSGADAKGAATILLQAAHLAFVSPGSGAGPGQPVRLDDPDASTRAGVADRLATLARRNGRDPDGARKLASVRLGLDRGARTSARPTACGRPSARSSCSSTARRSPPPAGDVEALDRQGDRDRARTGGASPTRTSCSTGSGSATRCCTG